MRWGSRGEGSCADGPSLAAWLMSNTINRLVLAITSKETLETLERWQFDIIREDSPPDTVSSSIVPAGSSINGIKSGAGKKEKTEKEVQGEIREIMKQITASVTFLPTLEEECTSNFFINPCPRLTHSPPKGTFTLLAYTSTSDPLPLPEKWADADPHLIEKGKVEQVRLRSFSTNVHKMEVSCECGGVRGRGVERGTWGIMAWYGGEGKRLWADQVDGLVPRPSSGGHRERNGSRAKARDDPSEPPPPLPHPARMFSFICASDADFSHYRQWWRTRLTSSVMSRHD